MTKVLRAVLVVAVAVTGCSSNSSNNPRPPAPGTGGAGGDTSTGGSGGSPVLPPSGSTGGSGGAGATGGSGGTGGSTGGSGGSGEGTGGVAADGGRKDASRSDAPPSALPPGGMVEGWYEAEAIPPNEKAARSEVHVNPANKCSTMPPKVGEKCSSGGGEVTWITEGRQGWLQFNGVMAPSDGMYDVSWWYHCGNNDNFGDKHCGGQTNPPTTASGCRPHQIVVNGTEMTGTYHWPCFPGSFSEIHAVTTQLPLKAGANTIKVYPKSRDSADMDAIQVQPMGKGIGPLIMSNSVVGSN
jgi:hypothetical protein